LALPAEAHFSPASVFNDYEETTSKSQRINGGSDRQISIQLPAVLPESTAISLADHQLRQSWFERDRLVLATGTSRLDIGSGSVVTVPEYGDRKWLVEEVETGVHPTLSLRALLEEPTISSQGSELRSTKTTSVHLGHQKLYLWICLPCAMSIKVSHSSM
jgi:hypothetical protein